MRIIGPDLEEQGSGEDLLALQAVEPRHSVVAVSVSDRLLFTQAIAALFQAQQIPLVLHPEIPRTTAMEMARSLGANYFFDARLSQLSTKPVSIPNPASYLVCSSGTTSDTNLKAYLFARDLGELNAKCHYDSIAVTADTENEPGSILCLLPPTHSFGFVTTQLAAPSIQAQIVLPNFQPTPQTITQIVEEHDIKTLMVAPSQLRTLKRELGKAKKQYADVSRVSIGSSLTFNNELAAYMEALPSADFYITYGVTELGPRVSTFRAGSYANRNALLNNEDDDKPVYVGETLPGVEAKIADGQLLVKSQFMTKGILKGGEIHPLALDDGFYNTKDRAEIHDRSIRISGRADNVIIRAGANIFPEEIEQKAMTVPDVRACVLIGKRSKIYGQVPYLIIDAEPSLLPELKAKIFQALKRELSQEHMPVDVLVSNEFPRTSSGKVKRNALARMIFGD